MYTTKNKKVLIISRSFPPENISAVQRPFNFVKYLPQFGWKPYVITTKKNTGLLDHSLLNKIDRNILIEEVFSLDPDNLRGIFRLNEKKAAKRNFDHHFLNTALKLYSAVYYRTTIIDYYDGWIPCGLIKSLKLIKKAKIDLIYAHGQPPSSFVVGLLLKKITGKPLVIDYDDSWTTSVYEKKQKGIKKIIRQSIEAKLLKTADKVISVKKTTINEIMETFYGVENKKFKLITNGYDPKDFCGFVKKKNSKFVITYTGTISDKYYYSPESFLKAIGKLIAEKKLLKENLKIKFIGMLIERYKERFLKLIRQLDINDIIELKGHCSHKECIESQMKSDLLLYIIESLHGKDISYQYAGVLPAKIFEYIYTGVPILAIVPPGYEADLIKKTKTGFIAEPNDVNSIKYTLLEIFKKHKDGNLPINPDSNEIKKFDRKYLTGELATVFNNLLNHTSLLILI